MHTLRCYRSDLNQLQRFLSDKYDHHELVGIDGDWVRAWVVHMMQEGRSPRTIHREGQCLPHIQSIRQAHVLH